MKNGRSNNKVLSAIIETLKELTEARNREEIDAWQAYVYLEAMADWGCLL